MARLVNSPGAWDLDTAIGALRSCESTRPAPVVVTFDDGTADFVDTAVPILVKHGVPATLYVATDFIESGRPFPDEGRPASWKGLADALSTGLVTIGSHTHTHTLLDRHSPDIADEEMRRSKDLIGERLGVVAEHFAYPKALFAPRVEPVVRRHFRSAAIAGTRGNPFGATDLYRIRRSPVQVTDGLTYFDAKARGGMRLEDDLRRLANRYRQAKLEY